MTVRAISIAPLRRISPVGGESHYFYGYYDNYAFDVRDRLHLCNRVAFMDRLPTPEDVNELGVIDLETSQFSVLACTQTWNFQQGSMLEWNPANRDEILYNTWQDDGYRCIVQNIRTGAKKLFSRALADVSPDGKYGLAVNFSRIYDFRPGYGYCLEQDPWRDVPQPDDDGIFLVDMLSGDSRLLISYRQMGRIFNTSAESPNSKIVINHITFNQSSDRFLFLVRNFPPEGGGWKTALGTADLDGRVYKLRSYTYASHYSWKDGNKLLIHADCGEGNGLYELSDQTQDYTLYNPEFFTQDIHCSYSPDKRFILGDGYPDQEHYRSIHLYNINTHKRILLGRFYSPATANTDVRCDLHARWSRNGQMISFDSIHEGYRGVYTMDLAAILDSQL